MTAQSKAAFEQASTKAREALDKGVKGLEEYNSMAVITSKRSWLRAASPPRASKPSASTSPTCRRRTGSQRLGIQVAQRPEEPDRSVQVPERFCQVAVRRRCR